MLDYRTKTFLTVCKTLNFTTAAKQLNITQPAVSQHIHFVSKSTGRYKLPRQILHARFLKQICVFGYVC